MDRNVATGVGAAVRNENDLVGLEAAVGAPRLVRPAGGSLCCGCGCVPSMQAPSRVAKSAMPQAAASVYRLSMSRSFRAERSHTHRSRRASKYSRHGATPVDVDAFGLRGFISPASAFCRLLLEGMLASARFRCGRSRRQPCAQSDRAAACVVSVVRGEQTDLVRKGLVGGRTCSETTALYQGRGLWTCGNRTPDEMTGLVRYVRKPSVARRVSRPKIAHKRSISSLLGP